MKAASSTVPNIWLVILTYNGLDDTRKCLDSIDAARGPRLSTLVVDNGSSDETVAKIRSEYPWCVLLDNGRNEGFTGGNNRGIEYALAEGAEWVVLLNNDTVISADFNQRMCDAAVTHADFGIIGPIVNYMDEPAVVMIDGFRFNAPRFQGFFQPAGVAVDRAPHPTITDVDVVDGCCMMIATPALRQIGLLDERFFIYHEVTDYCLAARKAGFRCGVIGDQLVWHKGTSSFKKTGKRLPRYYDARNLGLVLWKHRGATHHGRSAAASAGMYLRYVYWRYCVEAQEGHRDSAHAVVEGLCDALAVRFGGFVPRRRVAVPVICTMFEAVRRRRA